MDTPIWCNIHKRSDVESCQVCEEETEPLCFECGKPLWSGESSVELNDEDWTHESVRCPQCNGKGYLTPEEAGLGKM